MFKHLEPAYDSKRVCIKIPATWEGLQACRELEKRGIVTLATTMFCMEQAALAADAGCTYIAPYVNELKVHFEKGSVSTSLKLSCKPRENEWLTTLRSYIDQHKAFAFCGMVQRYYRSIQTKTKVLPASLTSIDEVLVLAGVDHITIAPLLLAELAATPAEGYQGDIGSVVKAAEKVDAISKDRYAPILRDEAAWRLAFSRSEKGRSEGKIIQAVNIFYEMQEGLEALVKKLDQLS